MSLPVVAIALGDPAGIGPEIAIKAALHPTVRRLCVPVLAGDVRTAELHARACHLEVSFDQVSVQGLPLPQASAPNSIAFLHRGLLGGAPLELGKVRAHHGRAAVGAARMAIEAALNGRVSAVVACPQNELAIKAAAIEFDGYPGFVASCTNTPADDVFLMICFDDKRVVHVTLHVSVRHALELITEARVLKAIATTEKTLRSLGITAPRIAVAGLNPHAGEHGLFGAEDEQCIAPAIERAKALGIDVSGPITPDLLFHHQGYDAFIVMLHDHGHIPVKLLAPRRASGFTIGAPVLFCSVAHGTALDIAGRNEANPAAVIEAIQQLIRSGMGGPANITVPG